VSRLDGASLLEEAMAEEAIITLGVCEKGRLVGKLIS